jgi:intracellular sulfur oxidation DsrE/DsrF family protein
MPFILGAAVWLAGSWPAGQADTTLPPSVAAPDSRPPYLFRVSLHTPEELEGLLARAEQLANTTPPVSRQTGIALVLHGPEVEIFARKNYAKYRHIVDRAARLSTEGVIQVKMCQTEMRSRDIRDEDVPKFIEFVPYGPDEEARLQQRGYVYF